MYSFSTSWMTLQIITRQLQSVSNKNCTCRLISTAVVHYERHKNSVPKTFTSTITNAENPGVGRRLKIMRKVNPDVLSTPLHEEDLEEIEGDFLNARQMQEYSDRIADKLRHRDERKMTERKHFRPPVEPNMLTWSDKEQIRNLHRMDSVKWNVDKLAESFPATPHIIKKILKAEWKPNSKENLLKHDKKVTQNWEDFSKGTLNVSSPTLKEHLRKFTKRTFSPYNEENLTVFKKELPKPESTEFSSIIQSYKLLSSASENSINLDKKNKVKLNSPPKMNFREDSGTKQLKNIVEDNCENTDTDISEVTELNNNDNNLPHANPKPMFINNKSDYTLDTLRDEMRKKQKNSNMQYISEHDKAILKTPSPVSVVDENVTFETVSLNENNGISNKSSDENSVQIRSASSKTVANFINDQKLSVTNIKKRIHIPKSKVKVGYLYKVDDCYYSHDGFFLYRVPGMINENSEM